LFSLTSCSTVKDLTGTTTAGNQNASISQARALPANAASPAGNVSAKPAPSISAKAPVPPGFEKFAVLDTEKFYQTAAFSVFDKRIGYLKNVSYNYAYSDGRFDKMQSYKTDVQLNVYEFASAEKAQAYFKNGLARAIPAAQADTVKLPRCVGEKSGGDEFVGPDKIIKRLRHPNGGEIVVTHSGDFNMYDCKRGSNRSENVAWTDGVYYFGVSASPYVGRKDGEPGSIGYGRAEEFALDYLAALKQPVTP